MAEVNVRYGDLDGFPCIYNSGEAWVLHGGKWVELNAASINNGARVMEKDAWYQHFDDPPPLPPEAFRPRE